MNNFVSMKSNLYHFSRVTFTVRKRSLACFTHKKSCLCEIIDFCSVCLPLNPVIKETLDVKAGHMLSTAGYGVNGKRLKAASRENIKTDLIQCIGELRIWQEELVWSKI